MQPRKEGRSFSFGTPKNGKSRTLSPAPFVMETLQAHKKAKAKLRIAAGPAWDDGGFPNVRVQVPPCARMRLYERYCGDVFTRKTFTPSVISHRSVKNRGERPRSRYFDEHEAIISRDDFIAVQRILNNSKYSCEKQ